MAQAKAARRGSRGSSKSQKRHQETDEHARHPASAGASFARQRRRAGVAWLGWLAALQSAGQHQPDPAVALAAARLARPSVDTERGLLQFLRAVHAVASKGCGVLLVAYAPEPMVAPSVLPWFARYSQFQLHCTPCLSGRGHIGATLSGRTGGPCRCKPCGTRQRRCSPGQGAAVAGTGAIAATAGRWTAGALVLGSNGADSVSQGLVASLWVLENLPCFSVIKNTVAYGQCCSNAMCCNSCIYKPRFACLFAPKK